MRNNERPKQLAELRKERTNARIERRRRLNMCRRNAFIDLARAAFNYAGSSTHHLQQLSANATAKQLDGIPSKYWKAIRSLDKVSTHPLFSLSYL